MTWKYFLYYWAFVRGIHWTPVDSPRMASVMWGFDVFYCYPKTVAQTVKLLLVWDAMTLMWSYCKKLCFTDLSHIMSEVLDDTDMLSRWNKPNRSSQWWLFFLWGVCLITRAAARLNTKFQHAVKLTIIFMKIFPKFNSSADLLVKYFFYSNSKIYMCC